MPNSPGDPVELIKRAALAAVESAKPVNIMFGTVVGASPLQINVEQKMTLGEKQLILCRNVSDYTVMMEVDHETEENETQPADEKPEDTQPDDSPEAVPAHTHKYQGQKEYKVLNALKTGEKVILLRVQGGQKFLVLDRLEA